MALTTRLIKKGQWKDKFVITSTYKYYYDKKSYVVPKGFVTDFRSFVIVCWKLTEASVPHDWHYWLQDIPKYKADWIYAVMVYNVYRKLRNPLLNNKPYALFRAATEYLGVALFGWFSWYKNKIDKRKDGYKHKFIYIKKEVGND